MSDTTTASKEAQASPERREVERLKEVFVTKREQYTGGVVIVMAVLAALSWVYAGARSSGQDAAKAEVASAKNELAKPVNDLGTRVTATETDLKGVKEQVKALDDKVEKTKTELTAAITTSAETVKEQVKASKDETTLLRGDVANLTTLMLTGKVPIPTRREQ